MIDIGASDFYNTIKELGEEITFLDHDGGTELSVQHAAIAPNRRNQAIGTTDGACWYAGNITFDSIEQQQILTGSYFRRTTKPQILMMLYSIFPENSTEHIGTVNCVECNDKVDIISHYEKTGEVNEFGEPIFAPVYIHRDVDCFFTVYTKEAKNAPVGAFVETVTYVTMPAKYTVSVKNTIMRKGFFFNETTKQNEYGMKPYKVESVDTSMTNEINGELCGTVRYLITESPEK